MLFAVSSAGAQIADTLFRTAPPGKPSNINTDKANYVVLKGGKTTNLALPILN
jgi:hypothetical protein